MTSNVVRIIVMCGAFATIFMPMSHAAKVQAKPIAIAQGVTPSQTASFDAASVRPSRDGCGGKTTISPPGSDQFIATNISLRVLIAFAYDSSDQTIEGIPKQLNSTCFDVVAESATSHGLSYEAIRPMVRNLLTQRFLLAAHYEMVKKRGYVLLALHSDTKLTPSDMSASRGQFYPDKLVATGASSTVVAKMLSRILNSPVVDQTGLHGRYNISLSFAPMDGPIDTTDLPSIFTAVREQLGLTLKARKVSIAVLVVDHVAATPTHN